MTTPRHSNTKAQKAAAAAVLLACATFALWPQHAWDIPTPVIETPEVVVKQVATLDPAAFRVPLWVAEPAPPAPPVVAAPAKPPAAAPPPSPIKLQLLAIIREVDVYKAAVYDPDADRILVVGVGEKIGPRNVDKVDKTTLTLRDSAGKRILALKDGS